MLTSVTAALVKAQQAYHAKAAETLAAIQADLEESAVGHSTLPHAYCCSLRILDNC